MMDLLIWKRNGNSNHKRSGEFRMDKGNFHKDKHTMIFTNQVTFLISYANLYWN